MSPEEKKGKDFTQRHSDKSIWYTVGPVGRLVQPQYKAGVRWALYIKPKFWNLKEGNKNIQIF